MSLVLVWSNPNPPFDEPGLLLRWQERTEPTELEMSDEHERDTAAHISAQQYLIEILLSELLHRIKTSGADANEFIETVLRVSQRTDHLSAQDDETAEMLSDVAVRTQQSIANIVDRAIERAGVK